MENTTVETTILTKKQHIMLLHLTQEEGCTEEEARELIAETLEDDRCDTNLSYSITIYTEQEVEDAIDEKLERILDEEVYPEIPTYLRGYFDAEHWKRDQKIDGAEALLSSYDGGQFEYEIDGEYFYVYRN